MINWIARLKSEISKMGQGCTDVTDKTNYLAVLAVPTGIVYKFPDCLSSVSSVGIWAVFENSVVAADLIEAAMKVCDRHGDGDAARADMRQQCLELSPAVQADLLDHFNGKLANFWEHHD